MTDTKSLPSLLGVAAQSDTKPGDTIINSTFRKPCKITPVNIMPFDVMDKFRDLPIDIHLHIVNMLPFPEKIALKQTCSLFNELAGAGPITLEQLLAAEREVFAQKERLFTCSGCLLLLPEVEFVDRMVRGKYGRNGSERARRKCGGCAVDDWDDPDRFLVDIQGFQWHRCLQCGNWCLEWTLCPVCRELEVEAMELDMDVDPYDGEVEGWWAAFSRLWVKWREDGFAREKEWTSDSEHGDDSEDEEGEDGEEGLDVDDDEEGEEGEEGLDEDDDEDD